MIKAKAFVTLSLPREFLKYLPGETFVDHSNANRFIEEIGPERVISIAGGDHREITIFYEANGLLTCPDCNQDHAPDQSFCHLCGKQLVPVTQPEVPTCPHCGKPLRPKAAFCSFCGQRLPELPKKKGLWG